MGAIAEQPCRFFNYWAVYFNKHNISVWKIKQKIFQDGRFIYFKLGYPCWRKASYTNIAAVFERFSERT